MHEDTPPLTYDEDLERQAIVWAEEQMRQYDGTKSGGMPKGWVHDPDIPEDQGENLAYQSHGYSEKPKKSPWTCVNAIYSW